MKICYPWTPMEKLPHSQGTTNVILSNLKRLKFPAERYKSPPDKRIVVAVDRIIHVLHAAYKNDSVIPWVLLLSRSENILQALATLIPWSYCLTTSKSCMQVKIDDMIDWLKVKPPIHDMDFDVVGNQLTEVERTGVLSLERIDSGTTYTTSYSGKILRLLESRLRHRKMTLFTASHNKENAVQASEEVFLNIEHGFGPKVKSIIKNYAHVLNIKSKRNQPALKEIEV